MKKIVCICILMLCVLNLAAQRTSIEQELARAEKDSTRMDRFVNNCIFYSEEVFVETPWKFAVKGEAIIYTDLINQEKVGGIKLWDGEDDNIYFGTIDFDEIDNLILALRTIIDEKNVKHYGLEHRIVYRSRGGIGVNTDNSGSAHFSKVWVYIARNGEVNWMRVDGEEGIDGKDLIKFIEWLENAKKLLEKEIAIK